MKILVEAERLMNSRPDSALTLLDSITAPESLSARDNALYCLLITQARDKNYLPHTSDSVIRHAVNYFEQHNDPKRMMTAYYTLGRVKHYLQQVLEAQEYYLKAQPLAEKYQDLALLARIHSNLGMLYNYQYAYEEALIQMKKAEQYLVEMDDTISLSVIFRDLGRTFSVLKQLDSAIAYYEKALRIAPPLNKAFMLNELAGVQLLKGNPDIAYNYVREALKSDDGRRDFSPVYLVMGKVYKEMGQTDSALYYLEKAANYPEVSIRTKAAAYYYLYHLHRENQQWTDYARFQKEYEILRDSIEDHTHSETVQRMQALFDNEQIEKENNLLELRAASRQRNIAYLLLGIVVLTVLFVRYIYHKRRQARERIINMEKFFADITQMKFSLTTEQIETNRQRLKELEIGLESTDRRDSETISLQKDLLNATNALITGFLNEKENAKNLMLQSEIVKKLHTATDKVPDSDHDLLFETVNNFYPEFYSRLKQIPDLTRENIQTAYLLKAQLTQPQITRIVSANRKTAGMRLKSLAERVFGSVNKGDNYSKAIADYIQNL
jgi:tetratricopeptide (TPR) repeat protein